MSRFWALMRQRLRRDWVQLVLWIGGTAVLASVTPAGALRSYGDEQDRVELLVTVMANPVILLFRGLPSGAGEAAMVVFLIFPWLAMLAAFMSTFLAVRHTRMDEETGRMELVSASPAGRWLPTVATITHGVLANALLGVLVAVAFLGAGFASGGSWLVGAATAAVGLVFLGVGLVAAQLFRTSRGANTASVMVLLVTFVLAGIGNALGTPSDDLQRMESSWLTWLSPFGWGENTRAFDDDAWWPVALSVGAFVVLTAVALALQSVRDIGASLVPERHGRAEARGGLRSSTALVWRLTYGSIIGWAIGGFLVGALATSLGGVIDQIGGDNPAVSDVLDQIAGAAGGSLAAAMVVVFYTMVGIFCACCAVQTVIRARQEEAHGTAEVVLALPVQRVRWLADFVMVGAIGVVVIAAAALAGSAAGAAGQDGAAELMRNATVAAAGQVVAASVFLGLTALVFVLAPRLTIALGWGLVLLAAAFGLFGPIFGFPDWMTNLSPFAVSPVPEPDGVDLRGLWWLLLALALGVAASLGLMRRRELAAGG